MELPEQGTLKTIPWIQGFKASACDYITNELRIGVLTFAIEVRFQVGQAIMEGHQLGAVLSHLLHPPYMCNMLEAMYRHRPGSSSAAQVHNWVMTRLGFLGANVLHPVTCVLQSRSGAKDLLHHFRDALDGLRGTTDRGISQGRLYP